MRPLLKIIAGVCILSSVILLGYVFGWFGSKSPTAQGPDQGNEIVATPDESVQTAATNPRTGEAPRAATQHRTNVGNALAPVTSGAGTTNAEWEDKLEAILTSEGEDSEKTKQLFAMLPQLPEDGQVEVAQHLSNLVSDQDYAPLGKMLADPKQPEAVQDILIADLLNRPNATKLPLLLEVARNMEHSKAVEAKDLLELYLEEDYGQDWAKWQAKTEQWLKDNPD